MKTCYLFDIDIIERSTRPTFPKLPNHALTKFSSYFKQKGYEIKLVYSSKLIPLTYNKKNLYIGSALYTPNLNRFKKRLELRAKNYNTKNPLTEKHIKIGTPTDYCPITDIKGLKADYTEYDEMLKKTDIKLEWYPANIGFLTRHCIRGCSFCVNRDRRKILQVNTLEEIYQKKGERMELLDDNLFAYPHSARLFNEIADFYEKHKIPFKLRNGLDCREVTEEKVKALQRASVAFDKIHCAWDNVRQTFIFKNINSIKKGLHTDMGCYLITGVNVNTEEEWKKDMLSFFYRYYLLDYIGVDPIIQVFEDDTQEYVNPWFGHYRLIKYNYNFQKNGSKVHLKRQLYGNQREMAEKMIEVLDEFSWIAEKNSGEIIYDPNFNKNMKSIADYLNIKHYHPITKRKYNELQK